MALARVWNDHEKEYVEKLDDVEYRIPGKKYIELEKFDALKLVSSYIQPKKDGLGNMINHKQLRLEHLPDLVVKPVEIKCQMCQGKFDTEKELILHSEAHHKDAIVEKKK
jgi:hypothetical protein